MAVHRPGFAFQSLVALLERTFAANGATIESPKYLRDPDTGQRREFDILISVKVGRHLMTTAIECKDQKRPVGVPQIEAFDSKCTRNHIGHRVVVSSSGFHPTAREKAKALGISCLELNEAERFNWLAIDAFWERRRRFEPISVRCNFQPGDLPIGEFEIFDEELGRLDVSNFLNAINKALPPEDDPKDEVGPFRHKVLFSNRMYAVDERQVRRDVVEAYAIVEYVIEAKPVPFQLHSYAGDGAEYAVASAELTLGGVSGRLVMAKNEDESISVSWTRAE